MHVIRGIKWVQGSPGKKWDCISKITRAKRAGSGDQALEHLPSKHEALSLIPSTAKIGKEEGEWKERRKQHAIANFILCLILFM
jgi:hypothetical protein